MAQRQEKFRLRLNLFDSIVLILALAAGAFLLWNTLKPRSAEPEQAEASTIRYTICLQRCVPGTLEAVAEGARLTDSIRNYEIGNVVSAWSAPAQEFAVDSVNKRWTLAEIDGYEDVFLSVAAEGTISSSAVTLSSGYLVRTGANAYVQGDGFLGSGYIYAIERGEN